MISKILFSRRGNQTRGRIDIRLFAVSLFLFAGQISGFAQTTPEQAARQGLPAFLAKIPPQEMELFGFTDASELQTATVGIPLPLFTIRPQDVLQTPAGATVGDLLTPTTQWFVPVEANGHIRAILVVDRIDGAFRAVSLGYAPLARELDLILRYWQMERQQPVQLVHVFQAGKFLFHLPDQDPFNLTEIRLGKSSELNKYTIDYTTLGRMNDTLYRLRPLVRHGLNQ